MLFHDSLFFLARTRPQQVFIEDHLGVVTCEAAAAQALRMAHGLAKRGVGPGDRVAVLSRNSAALFLTFHAASLLGATPVPLNYRLAPPEWAFILTDAGVVALIAEPEYHGPLADVVAAAPGLRTTLSYGAGGEGWTGFPSWAGEDGAAPSHRAQACDLVYQMYTSGTTGRPKGVMITHANYAANLAQVVSMLERRPEAGGAALVVTPLYHAAAVWICSLAAFLGLTIRLHRDFDAKVVADELAARRIGFTFLVPAMIQRLLVETPDLAERDWSALQTIMYGASPIAEETLRQAIGVFGCDFYQAYGLTETTAILTLLGAREHRRALAGEPELLLAAGRALPGTELAILDPDGRPSPPGVAGEICARGPQIMRGYFNMPEATAAALADGWFHSGDAAVMDEDGYVFIRDRLKDMVVSGGENVYPREVENVLFEHPDVADAAVIGVPDDRYGEALMAFVVLRPGRSLTAEAVTAFCRERLAGYKTPRRVEFREDLPRNASGKVLKTELRAPFWSGRGRAVG